METRCLPLDEEGIEAAAHLLQEGLPVAIPTETVYGLAANALDEKAVEKIFAAKGRPQDNPLIVHIAAIDDLYACAAEVPDEALRLARAFWPGPLTLVLKSAGRVAKSVSAGLDTVGIRMPANEGARALIARTGFPLAAPSANLSGSPSPTKASHVLADLDGSIPLVLDGGPSPVGVESTVLSLVEEPLILRPGFVTAEEIEEVLEKKVFLSGAVDAPLEAGQRPKSPGMKYRHYAPRAKLYLVEGTFENFSTFVARHREEGTWALCFDGEEESLALPCRSYGKEGSASSQGAALFSALRYLDKQKAQKVYARAPHREGRGLAVYNRLLRAAGFRVIEV